MCRPCACNTRTGTPLAPGRQPRAGSGAGPSERRSRRPPLPPHRVLDPEGDRAFEDIALHRQLGVLLAQPGQLRPLVFAQSASTVPAAPLVGVHPVAQGALVDPQVPGHLRNRPTGLPDQPHRALPEILIELPARFRHRPSSFKAMCPRYEGKPSCSMAWRAAARAARWRAALAWARKVELSARAIAGTLLAECCEGGDDLVQAGLDAAQALGMTELAVGVGLGDETPVGLGLPPVDLQEHGRGLEVRAGEAGV